MSLCPHRLAIKVACDRRNRTNTRWEPGGDLPPFW